MRVSEAMTRDVKVVSPDQTIREAARVMAEIDVGALPVGENDRLVGMITDRDIAVRAVAQGRPVTTKVRDIMSKEVLYCFDDQDLDGVARNMGDVKVRRLPVVSRSKRLVGIIALGDLAQSENAVTTGQALADVSTPGGAHSQTASNSKSRGGTQMPGADQERDMGNQKAERRATVREESAKENWAPGRKAPATGKPDESPAEKSAKSGDAMGAIRNGRAAARRATPRRVPSRASKRAG